jgi:hypothetical protein
MVAKSRQTLESLSGKEIKVVAETAAQYRTFSLTTLFHAPLAALERQQTWNCFAKLATSGKVHVCLRQTTEAGWARIN